MVGTIFRFLRDGDFKRDSLCPSIRFCCCGISYFSIWLPNRRFFWKGDHVFKHRNRERFLFDQIFSGWHNAELLAIRPVYHARFFVFAESSNWANIITSRPLLISLAVVSDYYSGDALCNNKVATQKETSENSFRAVAAHGL